MSGGAVDDVYDYNDDVDGKLKKKHDDYEVIGDIDGHSDLK